MKDDSMNEYQQSQSFANINDFSGHTINSLYIKQKHTNFKEEIFNYSSDEINLNQYNKLVITKSNEYMRSDKGKSIQATSGVEQLHYGITQGEKISSHHIIAVILYCDFSKLCTNFSKTFRNDFPSETIESVKQRNAKYWWFSKHIRELVQCFGVRGKDGFYVTLYCGMSCIMIMPGFSLRFCAPNSTTTVLNVAMNFSGDNGIIIQLNNELFGGGKYEKYFDVSWISKYKEEEERLLVGGRYPMQIKSVRNRMTLENYRIYFRALYWFESIINGSLHMRKEVSFTAKDFELINMLIKYSNGLTFTAKEQKQFYKIPKYIVETWINFVWQKKTIVINFYYLDRYYKKNGLSSLIMESLQCDNEMNEQEISNITYSSNKCKHNMIKFSTLNIFKRMKQLIIYTSSKDGRNYKSYSLSLETMKSLIQQNNKLQNVECTIHGYHDKDKLKYSHGRSWIFDLYTSSTTLLTIPSKISDKITKDWNGYQQDTLLIHL